MLAHLGLQGPKVSQDHLGQLEQRDPKENEVQLDNWALQGSQELLGHLGHLDNRGLLDNQEMQGLVANLGNQVCKGLEAQ
jgi:hypothetical protein